MAGHASTIRCTTALRGRWLLAASLFFVTQAAPAAARAGDTTCTFSGDLNGDGLLSSGDAQTAFYIALGLYTPNYREVCAADCNHDGEVSSGDAQQVFMAGLGMAQCDNGCGPDAYEADGGPAAAGVLAPGVPESRSFCPAGDVDWLRFTLVAGVRVRLETASFAAGAAEFTLYDDGLDALATGASSGAGARALERELGAGEYFVALTAETGDVLERYDVTLTLLWPEICADDVDNDGDGLTDCPDPDCFANPLCAPPLSEICWDGLDNDGDDDIDCADGGCASHPVCLPESACRDRQDNDGDGAADCADSDCAATLDCRPELACTDLADNDWDGSTDCADPDCAENPACIAPERACQDGRDNDADGSTDCADPDCTAVAACGPEQGCQDGLDNDGDGALDCADPDCFAAAVCLPESACANALDDDGDGLADCADPDCGLCGLACCELGGGTHWLAGTPAQCQDHDGVLVDGASCLAACCALPTPSPEQTLYDWRLPGECALQGGAPAEPAACEQICCYLTAATVLEIGDIQLQLMTRAECQAAAQGGTTTGILRDKAACLRQPTCCDTPAGYVWTYRGGCPEEDLASAWQCYDVCCTYGEYNRVQPHGDCAGGTIPLDECAEPRGALMPDCVITEEHPWFDEHCFTCADPYHFAPCYLPDGRLEWMSVLLCGEVGGTCDDGTLDYFDRFYAWHMMCCEWNGHFSITESRDCIWSRGRPVGPENCRGISVCCLETGASAPAWRPLDMCMGDIVDGSQCDLETVCCLTAVGGHIALPRPVCEQLAGTVVATAQCEAVCCAQDWQHDAMTRGACLAAGRTVVGWAECASVCCWDGDPLAPGGYATVVGSACVPANEWLVHPYLCEERCCMALTPEAQFAMGDFSTTRLGNCEESTSRGWGVALDDLFCEEACCSFVDPDGIVRFELLWQGDCALRPEGQPIVSDDCREVCCANPQNDSLYRMLASDCTANGWQEVEYPDLCTSVCCALPDNSSVILPLGTCGARGGTEVGDPEACTEICCAVGGRFRYLARAHCEILGGVEEPEQSVCDCVADGAACAAGQTCCASLDGCPPGGVCPSCAGEHELCNAPGTQCCPGLACDGELCVACADLYRPCDAWSDTCCVGLTCVEGECTFCRSQGNPCGDHNACCAGLVCGPTAQCIACTPPGAACDGAFLCCAGTACVDGACAACKPYNAACGAPGDVCCDGLACDSNLCMPCRDIGAPCALENDTCCAGLACVDGSCQL